MYGPALQKALLMTCYEVLYGDKGGVLNQWAICRKESVLAKIEELKEFLDRGRDTPFDWKEARGDLPLGITYLATADGIFPRVITVMEKELC